MPLFLDIEVLQQDPEEFMVPDVATLKAPGNFKKAESIAAWRAEQAASLVPELRERSSLEPLLGGTVCAVGIAVNDQPPRAMIATTGDEAGELALLQTLEKGLIRYPSEPMVAWAGSGYDWPYLAKRALRHGLFTLARRCYVAKPWGDNAHVDAFRVWQCGDNRAHGKLREVAQYLGLTVGPSISGADVTTAWQAGRIDEVRAHVLEDVGLLREVYWRLRAAGWILGDDAIPDLPVRPPRTSVRDELMREAAELQVATDKSRAQVAAEEAGLKWVGMPPYEDGPQIDASTTVDQIRAFVDALKRRAA